LAQCADIEPGDRQGSRGIQKSKGHSGKCRTDQPLGQQLELDMALPCYCLTLASSGVVGFPAGADSSSPFRNTLTIWLRLSGVVYDSSSKENGDFPADCEESFVTATGRQDYLALCFFH
jgi:hypothetical protein